MTLSKPGLHGDLSPAGSSCQNRSRGAGGRQQGGFLTLCSALPVSPASSLCPPHLSGLGQNLGDGRGGGWGENPHQRFLSGEKGEGRVRWPWGTLTSPGSTLQNRTNAAVPGGLALGTGDKAEETGLAPALEGLHGAERDAEQTPSRQFQCREIGAVPRDTLGGSGSTEGAPNPALAGGTLAFYPLQSTVPSTRRGRDCVLTECRSDDRSKSDQRGKVQLGSCTPPGRLLRSPRYHSYCALLLPFHAPPGQRPVCGTSLSPMPACCPGPRTPAIVPET